MFIPSDSKVCLVLPGAWDLNSYLPDRTLAISLLPPFPGVLSLPATPGTLLAWLLPALHLVSQSCLCLMKDPYF